MGDNGVAIFVKYNQPRQSTEPKSQAWFRTCSVWNIKDIGFFCCFFFRCTSLYYIIYKDIGFYHVGSGKPVRSVHLCVMCPPLCLRKLFWGDGMEGLMGQTGDL